MAARPDNIDIRDQVIATLLDDSKRAPPPVEVKTDERPKTNYDVIQALSLKFAAYIKQESIPVPDALMNQLEGADPAPKLAFVKQYLCPRVHGMDGLIRDACKQQGIDLGADKVDKCVRYLRAMAEVADA